MSRHLIVLSGLAAVGLVVWMLRRAEPAAPDAPKSRNPGPDLVESATVPVDAGAPAAVDDPDADGWATESVSNETNAALKRLLESRESPERAARQAADAAFAGGELRPRELRAVFSDPVVTVERGQPAATGARGVAGLARELTALFAAFAAVEELHLEVKTFRIRADVGNGAVTESLVSLWGRTPGGMVEEHASWRATWSSALRLTGVSVSGFERTVTRHAEGPLFVDCTGHVLGAVRSFASQIAVGYGHWYRRTAQKRYFAILGTPGIAVGDADGDGLEDLYLCQERGLPNRLYLQNADGTLRDASSEAGVDWVEDSRSALFVDLDNDGDQDLVVAILGGVVVAENRGQARFEVRDVLASAEDTMSVSAADYDLDGDLDLYVCGYDPDETPDVLQRRAMAATSEAFVLHDANNGAPNSLWRNDGGLVFADATKQAGLDRSNHRFSFIGVWEDQDNDGDPDLYVANDYGRDAFYRNDGGRFTEASAEAGAEDAAGGMSASWGDYDRDGWMDLFVSNMYSSAGNRVTFQEAFKSDAPVVKERLQRFARGNTLLRNATDGRFENRSGAAGVEMGRWAWGSHFFDLNNDGWEDLLVSNGYITGDDPDDL